MQINKWGRKMKELDINIKNLLSNQLLDTLLQIRDMTGP